MVRFLRQTFSVFQVLPKSSLPHEMSTAAFLMRNKDTFRVVSLKTPLMLASFLPPLSASAACRLWFESRLLMPIRTPGPRLVSAAQLLPIDSSALPAATCSLHCQTSGTCPSNVPVICFALIHDEEVVLLQKPHESFFPNSTEKICDSVSYGV